jgi:hypothetical protein
VHLPQSLFPRGAAGSAAAAQQEQFTRALHSRLARQQGAAEVGGRRGGWRTTTTIEQATRRHAPGREPRKKPKEREARKGRVRELSSRANQSVISLSSHTGIARRFV